MITRTGGAFAITSARFRAKARGRYISDLLDASHCGRTVGSHLRTSVVPDHPDHKYLSQSDLQPWTQSQHDACEQCTQRPSDAFAITSARIRAWVRGGCISDVADASHWSCM